MSTAPAPARPARHRPRRGARPAGLLAPWAGLLDAAGAPAAWCRRVERAALPVGAVDTGVATCARTPDPPVLAAGPLFGVALEECTSGLRAPAQPPEMPPEAPRRSGARHAPAPPPRRSTDDARDADPSAACRPRGPERPAVPTPPPCPPSSGGSVSRILDELCPPTVRPTATRPAVMPPAEPPAEPGAVPTPAAPTPPAARPRAPRPAAVPSVRTGPRSAPLPPADCGEDLAARAAERVARRIGATGLPGLPAHRTRHVRRPAGDDRAVRALLDRLAHGPADLGPPAPGAQGPRPRGGDRGAVDGSGADPRRQDSAPAGRGPRQGHERSRAGGGDGPDLAPTYRGSSGSGREPGDAGRGEGTDAVLRAPGSAPGNGPGRATGWGRDSVDGAPARRGDDAAGGTGLPELPDRPGRLVALGGAGLDDSPHDGSVAGPAPSVLAGTLGTPPQPTAWDSSGVAGVGGAVPAVSAPVLERLLERVLDDAARRHGIEV